MLPSGGRQRVTSLLNETQGDVEAALARLNETTAKRAIKSLDECKGALNRQRKASASSSALKDTQQRLGRLDGSVPNPVLTYPPYEDFLRNKKIPQDVRIQHTCTVPCDLLYTVATELFIGFLAYVFIE